MVSVEHKVKTVDSSHHASWTVLCSVFGGIKYVVHILFRIGDN